LHVFGITRGSFIGGLFGRWWRRQFFSFDGNNTYNRWQQRRNIWRHERWQWGIFAISKSVSNCDCVAIANSDSIAHRNCQSITDSNGFTIPIGVTITLSGGRLPNKLRTGQCELVSWDK
jgi:hypothetical protein